MAAPLFTATVISAAEDASVLKERQAQTLAAIPSFSKNQVWRVQELSASAANQHGVLKRKLAAKKQTWAQDCAASRADSTGLRDKVEQLHARQLKLEDAVLEERNALVTAITKEGKSGKQVKTELEEAFNRLRALGEAQTCFEILGKAEVYAKSTVTLAQKADLFEGCMTEYKRLVDYAGLVSRHAPDISAGSLRAVDFVNDMVRVTFERIRTLFEGRLSESLEALQWPNALDVSALDIDATIARTFRQRFVELLRLQKMARDPENDTLYAIQTLAKPVNLRFRYHFHGKRQTNRIDKPEWFFAHALDAIGQHADIISADIQDLLDQARFDDRNALHEFITQIVDQVIAKIKSVVPRLLEVPPLLAHTIYQALEFDQTLNDLYGYSHHSDIKHKSTANVILKSRAWFDSWLAAERKYVDDKYYEIIGDSEAWQQTSDEQDEGINAVKPTRAVLGVRDLFDHVTDRYRPLPELSQRLEFLVNMQIPLADLFAQRIASAIDAIETLSIGIMRAVPGAIGEGSGARLTGGVPGLLRLCRASASARWLSNVFAAMGDDVFFLDFQADLSEIDSRILDSDTRQAIARLEVTDPHKTDETLFGPFARSFAALADRAEHIAVKHMQRELLGELKPYIARPWDTALQSDDRLSVSTDLMPALTLFSAFLSTVSGNLSVAQSQVLFRSLSTGLSEQLFSRLASARIFSAAGGQQLALDVRDGWIVTAARFGIFRRPDVGFRKIAEASSLLALSSDAASNASDSKQVSFAKAMSAAWSDDAQLLEQLRENVDIRDLTKTEIQTVLKKRPECWR